MGFNPVDLGMLFVFSMIEPDMVGGYVATLLSLISCCLFTTGYVYFARAVWLIWKRHRQGLFIPDRVKQLMEWSLIMLIFPMFVTLIVFYKEMVLALIVVLAQGVAALTLSIQTLNAIKMPEPLSEGTAP